ncbi:MAG: hypothetical protein HY677_01575, partial [Chloroflexi bacterium]|nr:hypothetical protein [Chloroflexota bacterium]
MDEKPSAQASGHHQDIPPVLAQEIDSLETQVHRFLREEIDVAEFRRHRQIQGVYGQRQAMRYMIRVRIPHGDVTPEQLERLALIAEDFAGGRGHVTTRQDVQFHFVHPERITEALRLLAEVGLHSREACGN